MKHVRAAYPVSEKGSATRVSGAMTYSSTAARGYPANTEIDPFHVARGGGDPLAGTGVSLGNR